MGLTLLLEHTILFYRHMHLHLIATHMQLIKFTALLSGTFIQEHFDSIAYAIFILFSFFSFLLVLFICLISRTLICLRLWFQEILFLCEEERL